MRLVRLGAWVLLVDVGYLGFAFAQAPPAGGGGLAVPSSVDQYTMVLGTLLPLAIAAINREAWAAPLKALAALGVCVIAAGLEVAVKGQFDPKHWGANALTIFFLVVTTYKGFWQPTGIADAVSKRTG